MTKYKIEWRDKQPYSWWVTCPYHPFDWMDAYVTWEAAIAAVNKDIVFHQQIELHP